VWEPEVSGVLFMLHCAGERMCSKCLELDQKIIHFRRFVAGHLFDTLTDERIRGLIEDLERQKEVLHLAHSPPAE
jgi:hypothetical protein